MRSETVPRYALRSIPLGNTGTTVCMRLNMTACASERCFLTQCAKDAAATHVHFGCHLRVADGVQFKSRSVDEAGLPAFLCACIASKDHIAMYQPLTASQQGVLGASAPALTHADPPLSSASSVMQGMTVACSTSATARPRLIY